MSTPKRDLPMDFEFLAAFDPVIQLKLKQNVEHRGDCVLWIGASRNGVHGAVSYKDAVLYVHRLAYIINHGAIPQGLFVLHTCDVGRCIAKDHLFAGTQLENVDDMNAKGRGSPPPVRFGEANNKVSMSDQRVGELRRRAGTATQRKLASDFNCSQSTVWRLVHNKTRAST